MRLLPYATGIALVSLAGCITPPPPGVNDPVPKGQKSPWSSTTLDLRLYPELTIWKQPGGGVCCEVSLLHRHGFDKIRMSGCKVCFFYDRDNLNEQVTTGRIRQVVTELSARIASRIVG